MSFAEISQAISLLVADACHELTLFAVTVGKTVVFFCSYRQAQGAVLEALPRLKALGIPTKRPEDYFAEMAKSDGHMKKVREKLISKQTSMELSEKAKKLREQRKYGKQVQVEVMKKRLEEKKKLAESVKKFRKGGRGEQDELDFLTELEGGEKKNQRNGQAQKNGPMK